MISCLTLPVYNMAGNNVLYTCIVYSLYVLFTLSVIWFYLNDSYMWKLEWMLMYVFDLYMTATIIPLVCKLHCGL